MIIDLFAGPGGFSEALRSLGLVELGLEIDEATCNTRYAAGHATWQTDVASVSPTVFAEAGVEGLIASPPCQDFSVAGSRVGIEGLRGKLVHEVVRWTHELRPGWLACEQVPSVLPVWRAFARDLEEVGYRTWTGLLNTADYGVPQTRTRAILMASTQPFSPPTPTHAENPTVGDFFAEPRKPWITMAEALGWDAFNVAVVNTGPAKTVTTESGGQWQLRAGVHRPTAPRDPLTQPAPTLAFGHDAAQWVWERPATTVCCDPRLSPPGWRGRPEDYDTDGTYKGERSMDNAVKITPAQAAVLQGFPPDYPFCGSRTKVFEQVGNAVPPPLPRTDPHGQVRWPVAAPRRCPPSHRATRPHDSPRPDAGVRA